MHCDVSAVSVAGAGVYFGGTSWGFTGHSCGQVSDMGETREEACRVVMPIQDSLQTDQRAEN